MSEVDLQRLAKTNITLDDVRERMKEDLALMCLLWKDFKSQPPAGDWMYASIMATKIAQALGCDKEFQALSAKLPKLKIQPE
jgi:hypothetical protein